MKNLVLTALVAPGLALAAGGHAKAGPATAPVTVTDTVTGEPGSWIYDFTVTSNLPGTNNIYFFGVQLPTTDVTGSPSGFGVWNGGGTWSNQAGGGSSTIYNDNWIGGSIAPGGTTSGFEVTDTTATSLAQVPWFAYADGDTYLGPGSFNNDARASNPGFEGLSNTGGGAVPEPASLGLVAAGLLGLGAIRRRRA